MAKDIVERWAVVGTINVLSRSIEDGDFMD
jgi:hypothetical protein